MSNQKLPEEVKRWTAKRRMTLVLQIVKGETTVRQAARQHGLKASDVQHWYDTFLSAGENSLRSHPRDEEARREVEIKRLKQKVGELVMDIDVLKEAQRMSRPYDGDSSDD